MAAAAASRLKYNDSTDLLVKLLTKDAVLPERKVSYPIGMCCP